MECPQNTPIYQIVDPCKGRKILTKCVISEKALIDLGLPVNATLEQIIDALTTNIPVFDPQENPNAERILVIEDGVIGYVLKSDFGTGDGIDGLSAYDIAVNNGFVGDEQSWLLSLKGEKGDFGSSNVQDGQELDLPYEGSNTFTIPDNYSIVSVYKDIALNKKARYTRTANTITILDTLEAGDTINVRGLVFIGEFTPITPPNLNDVTAQGSSTDVTIQSPNAVNDQDLVPLKQVQDLIEAIPVSDGSNGANADLTLDANRTHNLASFKLAFINGLVKMLGLELEVSTANSLPNKIWNNGTDLHYTDALGVNKNIGGDLSTTQIEVNSNTTALESWKGKLILVTASCTITVPNTLSANWACELRTMTSVTLDWVITTPFVWGETTPPTLGQKTMMHIMRRGSTNNIYLSY